MKEASKTPYLIRAIFEWCCDNGLTPYIAVKVDETTKVPMEYVKNGEIVLNVSPDATRNLKIGNDLLQFSARFAGVSREVSVPIGTVSGIFAKENGQGLSFQTGSAPAQTGTSSKADVVPPTDDHPAPPSGGRPRLQVVK
ncbi:MAG: ClpXP protease specificity-enhancing factor [Betaproteobacteria bacterium]